MFFQSINHSLNHSATILGTPIIRRQHYQMLGWRSNTKPHLVPPELLQSSLSSSHPNFTPLHLSVALVWCVLGRKIVLHVSADVSKLVRLSRTDDIWWQGIYKASCLSQIVISSKASCCSLQKDLVSVLCLFFHTRFCKVKVLYMNLI